MRRRLFAAVVLGSMALAPAVAAADETTPRERQWGLEQIRAPETWARTQGGGTVVAVVDTGVDLGHPDLASRLLRDAEGEVVGIDLVDGGEPQDEHGHGTQVAGIIAAAGEEPGDLTGVAPDAKIMPVRALDHRGAGSGADIDEGIRWAVDNGADVINLSLESAVPLPGELVTTGPDQAVRYAWERGVVVVAAVGNSGTPFTDYPSSSPVVLVGATDREDRRATFSDGSRGDMLFAPGVDIVSTSCSPCGPDGDRAHREASGTSFAAPHVAGAVALLRATGLDAAQTLEALRERAVDVPNAPGAGRIDVAAALNDGPHADEDGNGNRQDEGPDRSGGDETDRPAEPASEERPDRDETEGRQQQESPSEEAQPQAPAPAPEPEEEPDPPTSPEEGDEVTVRPEPPAASNAPDVDPQPDEVALPTRDRPRVGALEAVAAGLVGLSATAVGVARRRWPAA